MTEHVGRSVCLSVGLSVRKVYFGKTAEWIWLPFGIVSGVGRGMGVLDGDGYRRREGAVLGLNLGRPVVTNGDFVARLFSNYFGQYLLLLLLCTLIRLAIAKRRFHLDLRSH